jgi:hypothetical protein
MSPETKPVCYAPVFKKTCSFLCIFIILALWVLLIVLILLLPILGWIPGYICLIKQTVYRIQHCTIGNDNPNIPI